MENTNRVQTKITSQGLVIQIYPKTIPNSTPHTITHTEKYIYPVSKVNAEIYNIFKFSPISNSLLGLSTLSHDLYKKKHSEQVQMPIESNSLRTLLRLLFGKSHFDIDLQSLEATFLSHKFLTPIPVEDILNFLSGKEFTDPIHYESLKKTTFEYIVTFAP